MEKPQKPPILETDIGAERLALANEHAKQNLSNFSVAERCTHETIDTFGPDYGKNVLQLFGEKAIKLVKDIAA